jgi:hypothetical protein
LTQPHARLHKQHNALSFHHVWEVIASKYVLMMHLSGKANPSNILSKGSTLGTPSHISDP